MCYLYYKCWGVFQVFFLYGSLTQFHYSQKTFFKWKNKKEKEKKKNPLNYLNKINKMIWIIKKFLKHALWSYSNKCFRHTWMSVLLILGGPFPKSLRWIWLIMFKSSISLPIFNLFYQLLRSTEYNCRFGYFSFQFYQFLTHILKFHY